MFKGLKSQSNDEKAKLKSISGVTTLIIEEAEDLREEADFDVVDLSVRGSEKQPDVRTVLLLNPTDTEHFIYKRWFSGEYYNAPDDFVGQIKDTLYILAHWKDVQKHLPSSMINNFYRIKKEKPQYYNYVVDGAWMHQREGVVYKDWSVRDYKKQDKNIIAIDFGFSHPTAIVDVSIDDTLMCCWAKELCYESEMTPDDILNFLVKNKLMDRQIVADSARPEIIAYLKKKSGGVLQIKPSKKGQGSVLDGIHMVQDFNLFIDPTSKNLQRELNLYIWDDKNIEKPVKEWDDALDALRYGVMALKTKRNVRFIEF